MKINDHVIQMFNVNSEFSKLEIGYNMKVLAVFEYNYEKSTKINYFILM